MTSFSSPIISTNVSNIAITEVSIDVTGTVVSVEYTKTKSSLKQAWVEFSSLTHILDRKNNKKLYVKELLDGAMLNTKYATDGKRGAVFRFRMKFPSLPPGSELLDLIEFRGWEWKNLKIKNPYNESPFTNWTENSLKANWIKNGRSVVEEGIYEALGKGNQYVLALKQFDNKLSLIYLGGANPNGIWKEGDIKATLRKTAKPGLFKASWFMGDKSVDSSVLITFEDYGMKALWPQLPSESLFIKLYPQATN